MRALGFCVSVGARASSWPTCFTAAGIPALAVSGETSPRRARARRCGPCGRARSTCCSPSTCSTRASTSPTSTPLLLLRPTQSATVFLQQLGRGLRRTPDKPVLTVLDFIGQQRREFRFDLKYRALTGHQPRPASSGRSSRASRYLPSGCELVLDAVAQRTVLDNVRRAAAADAARTSSPRSARTATSTSPTWLRGERARARRRATRRRLVDGAAARGRTADARRRDRTRSALLRRVAALRPRRRPGAGAASTRGCCDGRVDYDEL